MRRCMATPNVISRQAYSTASRLEPMLSQTPSYRGNQFLPLQPSPPPSFLSQREHMATSSYPRATASSVTELLEEDVDLEELQQCEQAVILSHRAIGAGQIIKVSSKGRRDERGCKDALWADGVKHSRGCPEGLGLLLCLLTLWRLASAYALRLFLVKCAGLAIDLLLHCRIMFCCAQASGTPLPPDTARSIRTVLWGSPTGFPPDTWKQGFFFSRKPGLQFGLVQVRVWDHSWKQPLQWVRCVFGKSRVLMMPFDDHPPGAKCSIGSWM